MFLAPERDELRKRIDARFDAMLAAGALDEVRALAARKLDPLLPAMKAHGVPWLIRHLDGEITLAEAAEGAKNDTRRYTKRQFTWARHQLPDWTWTAPDGRSRRGLARLRALRAGTTTRSDASVTPRPTISTQCAGRNAISQSRLTENTRHHITPVVAPYQAASATAVSAAAMNASATDQT